LTDFVFGYSGSAAAVGGREHSAEARGEDLQPDGQEPRRQAHLGGVPRGQQSGSAHCAGALARRHELIGKNTRPSQRYFSIFTLKNFYKCPHEIKRACKLREYPGHF